MFVWWTQSLDEQAMHKGLQNHITPEPQSHRSRSDIRDSISLHSGIKSASALVLCVQATSPKILKWRFFPFPFSSFFNSIVCLTVVIYLNVTFDCLYLFASFGEERKCIGGLCAENEAGNLCFYKSFALIWSLPRFSASFSAHELLINLRFQTKRCTQVQFKELFSLPGGVLLSLL